MNSSPGMRSPAFSVGRPVAFALILIVGGVAVYASVWRLDRESVRRDGGSAEAPITLGVLGCEHAATRQECVTRHFQDLVDGRGADAAMHALENAVGASEFVRVNCHVLGHEIGRAALELYGSVAAAFRHGNDVCTAGEYP
jgi:hypothetical protein